MEGVEAVEAVETVETVETVEAMETVAIPIKIKIIIFKNSLRMILR
jgi:hypothetical protein